MARRRTARQTQRGKARAEQIKKTQAQAHGERVRRAFNHPTDHWSERDWTELLRAVKRKQLNVNITGGQRGLVRLTADRRDGHAVCVFASISHRELMAHLA